MGILGSGNLLQIKPVSNLIVKRRFIWPFRVVWAFQREIWLRGWTCEHDEEKNYQDNSHKCIVVAHVYAENKCIIVHTLVDKNDMHQTALKSALIIDLKLGFVAYICLENIKETGYLVVSLTKLSPIEWSLNIVNYSRFKTPTQILRFDQSWHGQKFKFKLRKSHAVHSQLNIQIKIW